MIRQCLVIDDDFEITALICDILSEHNFIAQGVSSAREALELGTYRLSEFDIIFSDLKMPQMDGFEFVAQVKDMGISTPIIAVTGLPDKGHDLFYANDGKKRDLPHHIISKPFTELDIRTVAKLLEQMKSA
ncbi:response regulator [Pseudobacteriovorax antillogorgiicola]|uniref:Response regulator receiver domain-containing protein n=1 Tax=Pseudobacteriovorax antillogorgiicola TaxID=1513793 RepID=A0A1Y6CL89_9BACT|nr:response regulator [Pseudobacteriovorax antillogorgiicola]TCS45691.1 response regulator receiver domain-containing protein [Pseudobacteriovorax antillogorgiicola]SMF73283.1 Response regulator receiver domain-containing protein [Pseudobacteriovorax antillogorgiicola]